MAMMRGYYDHDVEERSMASIQWRTFGSMTARIHT